MENTFVILREGDPFGKAALSQEGLYYKISCLCPQPCRIRVRSDMGEKELGLCVPVDGGFGLTTRVPRKLFGEGSLMFLTVEPKKPEEFIPVDPNVPFAHLSKLRDGAFAVRKGHSGVILPVPAENS